MGSRDTFHINNFDLLRLVAALQVVLFHTASRFDLSLGSWDSIVNAFPGVPIFFAMSGFLISAAYERSSSIGQYAKNRLLRILPALWICIALTTVVALGFNYELLNLSGLTWFLAQMSGLIYTPRALAEFGFGSYNGALWTIPVELQFYAVLPILYWLLSSGKSTTARLIGITLVFVGIALTHQYYLASLDPALGEPTLVKLIRYSFVPHIYLFLLGVCLQRLKAEQFWLVKGKGIYWLGAYLAGYYLLPDTPATHVLKLMMLGSVVISLAFTQPTLSKKLLGSTDISYGLYIYHGLVHVIFFELLLNTSWNHGAMVLLVTLALAVLSWLTIERPIIKRKRSSLVKTKVSVVGA